MGEQQRIAALFHYHKGRYGYRRITLALRNEGYDINHKTVRKLMRKMRLASCLRSKKYQWYKGTYGRVAPNTLTRDFKASSPNQKWVTDVAESSIVLDFCMAPDSGAIPLRDDQSKVSMYSIICC